MKAAVVYFSLTGQSERVAEAIKEALSELHVEAKVSRIVPREKLSWITNLVAPPFYKKIEVELDPGIDEGVELVFLVGPVWSFSPSIPVYSFTVNYDWKGKKAVLFVVCRYRGGDRTAKILEKRIKERDGDVLDKFVLKHPLPGILRTIKTYLSGSIPKGYGLGKIQIVEAKLKTREVVEALERLEKRFTKVAVIGGGPSGSTASYKLMQYFQEKGKRAEVVLFEPKNFFLRGPRGCNSCAGIIAGWEITKILGKSLQGECKEIEFPKTIIQSRIDGFEIVVDHERVFLPTRERYKPYSVFRGAGPLGSDLDRASLDLWLFSMAISRGVKHIKARVKSVYISRKGVLVTYQNEKGEFKEEWFDFVIGAFGSSQDLFKDLKVTPPKLLRTFQTEIKLSRSSPSLLRVDFLDGDEPGIATFTPKGSYATLSVLGSRDNLDKYQELLLEEGVLREGEEPTCFCSGSIPVTKAGRIWGDRFILIGDASGVIKHVTMEGIIPGIKAGEAAARAVVEGKPENYEKYIKSILKDSNYGMFLHLLWRVFGNGGIIAIVKSMEKDKGITEAFYRIMEMEPYRDAIAALNIISLLRLSYSYIRYTHLNYKLRALKRFFKLTPSQMLFLTKYLLKCFYHVLFRK